jgi:hypothetical protein
LENLGGRKTKTKPRKGIQTKIRDIMMCPSREDAKLSIGFLQSGYLIARLRPACGVEGCSDGGGVDITVDCAEDVFAQGVPGG